MEDVAHVPHDAGPRLHTEDRDMRVRIIVRKRRAPDGEEILRRILGDLGLSCSFDEQLPEQQAADPSEELLLIDELPILDA